MLIKFIRGRHVDLQQLERFPINGIAFVVRFDHAADPGKLQPPLSTIVLVINLRKSQIGIWSATPSRSMTQTPPGAIGRSTSRSPDAQAPNKALLSPSFVGKRNRETSCNNR